jgi:hypothetical protein
MRLRKLSVVLLALLLAAMAMVPMVSAEKSPEAGIAQGTGTLKTMSLSGVTLKVADSKLTEALGNISKTELTKEQFIASNQRYIDALAEKFGKDRANKMADEEYARIIGKTTGMKTASVSYVSSNVLQISGYDIYLWPYHSESQSLTDPATTPITFVFYHDAITLMSYLSSHSWGVTYVGWNEWGEHGSSSSSLHWTDSNLGTGLWGQLQQGSEFGDRYHVIITAGDYSSSLGRYWAYGNCHHEYYSNGQHLVYSNGWNEGRSTLYSTLSGGYSAYWVALYNSVTGYWDGWGQIFT